MKQASSLFLTACLFIFCHSGFSQNYYELVYFTDKNNSSYTVDSPSDFLSKKSIERRVKQNIPVTEKDLPVNFAYIDSIRKTGANVKYSSRWFNAALVEADSAKFAEINKFSFVRKLENVARKRSSNTFRKTTAYGSLAESYGATSNQINMLQINDMHEEGYRGEGVTIAVIDAGFKNVNSIAAFDSLVLSGRILATYDFVDSETNVYDDHDHGTSVLSVIAGYLENDFVGAAWKANYLLLRTEEVVSERLIEEVYWLVAAEYADSAGVDIINSSLGYSTFDNLENDHSYSDLDGNTTIITRAAEDAFATGMLVVNSAGNEGANDWYYIIAPADGHNVLAVGGVDANGNYYPISSKGPSADGRIKPDVAAMGSGVAVIAGNGSIKYSSGTSFAAPLVTGFAANLWQKFPDSTNKELLDLIKRSGSQYLNPDNLIGYGIPNYFRAKVAAGIEKVYGKNKVLYPNPVNDFLYFANVKLENVSVYDISGRQVRSYKVSDGSKINVSGLAPGVYHIIIISSEGKFSQTFVKD